jgi:hypothetical protein
MYCLHFQSRNKRTKQAESSRNYAKLLVNLFTLNTEAVHSSDTLVSLYQFIRRHMPRERVHSSHHTSLVRETKFNINSSEWRHLMWTRGWIDKARECYQTLLIRKEWFNFTDTETNNGSTAHCWALDAFSPVHWSCTQSAELSWRGISHTASTYI